MKKEINLNRKFIVFLILLCIISITGYYSYALFQVSVISNRVVVLKTANLDITTNGLEEVELTVNAGTSQTVTFTLASDIDIEKAYKMYYRVLSGSGTFIITSSTSFPDNVVKGVMNQSQTITLTIQNTGDKNIKLALGTKSGFKNEEVRLSENLNEVTLGVLQEIFMPFIDQIETTPVLDTNIKFYEVNGTSNGNGLYVMASTKNDKYPIYYYRGNVNNNNIYFAESCWKIVRTTSTGGLKLIYNGEATIVNGKKQCLQTTGTGTQLPTLTVFNTSNMSPAYAGYSLPTASNIYTVDSSIPASGVYYGSSIDQTTYELVDPQTTLDNNHHYSYNSTDIHATGISGNTGNVRYYYYKGSSSTTGYYITFAKTKNIQAVLNEMLAEPVSKENPSAIQGVINTWWSNYDATYGSYLEDTEWCNDRSIGLLNGWNPNGSISSDNNMYYTSFIRYNQSVFSSISNNIKNTNQPILTCSNPNDRLTVANGSLTYKLGLLTYDEVAMAGAVWGYDSSNSNYYLYTGQNYWLLSPVLYYYGNVGSGLVFSNGNLYNIPAAQGPDHPGVRPSLSLKLGTEILSGDGTATNPYIVTTD